MTHKKIKRERFGKLFKRTPLVPLYGDMHANLQHVLQRCPNFASAAASELLPTSKRDAEAVEAAYNIVPIMGTLRAQAAEAHSTPA